MKVKKSCISILNLLFEEEDSSLEFLCGDWEEHDGPHQETFIQGSQEVTVTWRDLAGPPEC